MVKDLLETTPTHVAEWILYMDSEAIFDDPSVTFAFEFYRGRDVILTGDSASWDSGRPCMLLRLDLSWHALFGLCMQDESSCGLL